MEDLILNGTMVWSGLLFVGLAIPLVRRRVRPNRFYGFRTRATLEDEALWYEVNAITGVDLLVVGVGTLVLTAIHLFGMMSGTGFVLVTVTWIVGGTVWSLVHGFVFLRRRRND